MMRFIRPRLRKPVGIALAGTAYAAAWLVHGGNGWPPGGGRSRAVRKTIPERSRAIRLRTMQPARGKDIGTAGLGTLASGAGAGACARVEIEGP